MEERTEADAIAAEKAVVAEDSRWWEEAPGASRKDCSYSWAKVSVGLQSNSPKRSSTHCG
jgi:hypothetical protein